MLIEDKFSKYLIYAFGEIFLVVIGILIALQINNWNEKRVNHKKAISLLSEMIVDLKTDTATFNKTINAYADRQLVKEQLLLMTDFSNEPVEDLMEMLVVYVSISTVNDNTYQKIKNLGITNLIKDAGLLNKINQYYVQEKAVNDGFVTWGLEAGKIDSDYWTYEQDIFESNEPGKFPLFQDEKENRKNLIKLITSIKVRNMLIDQYRRKQLQIEQLENMNENATKLIHEIEKSVRS